MSVTLIYTNWKRKKNLLEIIDAAKKQTFPLKIFIVDNASNDVNNKFCNDDSSINVIEKDNSLMCWERWLVAFDSDTKYICIMDDDICFSKNNVIESCFNFMENNINVDGIGVEGVKLNYNGYYNSDHLFSTSKKNINVTIIKGRFMFIKKESLLNVDTAPDLTCDDIKISSYLKNKLLPSFLSDCFYNLPEGTESLSGKYYQHINREYATKKYFK